MEWRQCGCGVKRMDTDEVDEEMGEIRTMNKQNTTEQK